MQSHLSEETHDKGEVITSSPLPIPRECKAKYNASVPDETPIAYLVYKT